MKYKIENNKTSYPLISVSNSILVNFMNLDTDIGSFIDAGRLFHNTDPLNLNLKIRVLNCSFFITACMFLNTTFSITNSFCCMV